MARRALVLTVAGVVGTALGASAQSRATSDEACGPRLCIPTPKGWFSSVGPGVVLGRPAAYVRVGNFRFSPDAARQEGLPPVPRGKVMISLGDFPITSASSRWRRVQRLTLPPQTAGERAVSWDVRFAGRAVSLLVNFGSAPNAATRELVNRRLLATHPRRR